jgi:FkbM family methyltransferase
VARRPVPLRAIRRGLRLADRPLSVFEVRADGLRFRSWPAFAERRVLEGIGWLLRRPGTVLYDIGAATGVYTLAAAKLTSVSQVIAFEPLADSYAVLEQRSREYPQIRCFNVALGDSTGEAAIHRSSWRNTSSFLDVSELTRQEFPTAAELEEDEPVQMVRLDEVVGEHSLARPDVVKMDVQGFEPHVIRGGEATLRSARICIVELSFRPLYESAPLFDDVYPLLRELGFRTIGFVGGLNASDRSPLSVDGIFERVSAG